MSFHLQTLLDLRCKAEKDAEIASAQTGAARQKADIEHKRLVQAAEDAWSRLRSAQASGDGSRAAKAADGQGRAVFLRRLNDLAKVADSAARAYAAGPLKGATRAEDAARAAHVAARQQREALEKHKAKEEAAARVVAERRSEDAAGDLAIAAHRRGKT